MTTTTTTDHGDVDVAYVIDRAASLLESDGKEEGDLWRDGLVRMYSPGIPCCVIGALAVSCGMRDAREIEQDFMGMEFYDPKRHVSYQNPRHVVLQTVMDAMNFTDVEQVMDWSDGHSDACVIETLRDIAAELREKSGAAA